jgi:hypothetical protein
LFKLNYFKVINSSLENICENVGENVVFSAENCETVYDLNQTTSTDTVVVLGRNSKEEIAAALLSVFYSAKLTQSALSIVAEFASILVQQHLPNSFNQCAKIMFEESGDSIKFEKFWFCKICNEYSKITQYQRRCLKCNKK